MDAKRMLYPNTSSLKELYYCFGDATLDYGKYTCIEINICTKIEDISIISSLKNKHHTWYCKTAYLVHTNSFVNYEAFQIDPFLVASCVMSPCLYNFVNSC